ncbi:MAG: hypothetical protein J0L92_10795 [Deltaproteobacteria bacterium]|nr:hypothetical protein [Deltaproteobacteria bacterium]
MLCLAALACALVACGSPRLSLRPTEHTFTASDYGSALDRWTRSADDFDFGRLTEVLHVTATFESHEMRWAYVVRYAADHSMTTEEREHLLERSLGDAQTRHRFFVTVGAPIFREGDLTGEQSDWRVLLVDDNGHQTEPVELLRIPRPSRDMRAYFPAIHRQRHVFRIAFPVVDDEGAATIEPGSHRVTLRFAGASGTVNLEWDLDGMGAELERP